MCVYVCVLFNAWFCIVNKSYIITVTSFVLGDHVQNKGNMLVDSMVVCRTVAKIMKTNF